MDNGSGKITSKTNFDDYNFASSAQPVISGKVAYIATVNKGVLAFDLETKTILWEREVGGALVGTAPYAGVGSKTVEGTPILSNGKLIFGASDGYLYAIDPANGAVLKKQNVGAPVVWQCGAFQRQPNRCRFCGKDYELLISIPPCGKDCAAYHSQGAVIC